MLFHFPEMLFHFTEMLFYFPEIHFHFPKFNFIFLKLGKNIWFKNMYLNSLLIGHAICITYYAHM